MVARGPMCRGAWPSRLSVMDGTDPAVYQPRLTAWGHTWRIGAMLAISLVAFIDALPREQAIGTWFVVLDVVLGLASYVLVHWRRRWPVPVALVLGLVSTVSVSSAGPGVLALASLATRRRAREVGPVGAVTFACWYQYETLTENTEPFWLLLLLNAVVIWTIIGWGQFIGSRRELVHTLRIRAETAEAERDARAREARVTERTRIAREMHDVLAHRISQISMHAGALSYRDDLDADGMRESAAVIQQKAHEALTDLRGVLGVLREEEGDLNRPQPTYHDLPALVAEARAGGTPIEYDDQVDEPGAVPEGVGRTVYRIVQEGITNAGKHAPRATLRIRVTGSPEHGIEVALRNPLGFGPTHTPGAGLGLVGLAERVEQRGGRLEHRVETEGTAHAFVLHAWLPWAA